MRHRWSVIACAILCSLAGAAAQGQKNAYMVTDPNGKGVYLIPEIIAGKTVNTTMSQPGAPVVRAVEPGTSYCVQVGAFAVPANVSRLTKRLERDHFRVVLSRARFERRNLDVGVVSIVGLASLEEAERVLGLMHSAYHLEGLIVPPGASTLAVQ